MFDQIPDEENEMVEGLQESARERGVGATLVGGLGIVMVLGLIVVLCVLGSGWGMTDKEGAERVLEESGYSGVTITGYRWFTCDRNDYFHTGFVATGPSGKVVTGTVCKGMFFKSSTVRLD
jgi:hypothetical protein